MKSLVGRVSKKKGPAPAWCGGRALSRANRALEVERQAEPCEPGLEDRGRVEPRAAIRLNVIVLRLVGRRLVAVQQVAEIDAGIHAYGAEPYDFRKPHVDLVSAGSIQPMVRVEQPDSRGAGRKRARRQTTEQLLHDGVRHEIAGSISDRARAERNA